LSSYKWCSLHTAESNTGRKCKVKTRFERARLRVDVMGSERKDAASVNSSARNQLARLRRTESARRRLQASLPRRTESHAALLKEPRDNFLARMAPTPKTLMCSRAATHPNHERAHLPRWSLWQAAAREMLPERLAAVRPSDPQPSAHALRPQATKIRRMRAADTQRPHVTTISIPRRPTIKPTTRGDGYHNTRDPSRWRRG
jgi:hypothetical protein